MRATKLIEFIALAATFCFAVPSTSGAQWHAAVYLGANHTLPAAVTINQPTLGRSLTFDDVVFEAKPFASPQYYGWRLGRFFRDGGWGVELEFIHMKAIGVTDHEYPVTGTLVGTQGGPTRMDSIVQRYQMTHGLNFALVNLVTRTPIGQSPWAVSFRTGIGPTLPHAESTVAGVSREQYQYAGIGGQLDAGMDVRLRGPLLAVSNYKLTYARPRIDIADGEGEVRTITHQIAFGLAVGLPR